MVTLGRGRKLQDKGKIEAALAASNSLAHVARIGQDFSS
jgi:hypothetical protein